MTRPRTRSERERPRSSLLAALRTAVRRRRAWRPRSTTSAAARPATRGGCWPRACAISCDASRRGPTRCRRGATRRASTTSTRCGSAWPSLPILTKADLRERFPARALRAQGVEGQFSATGGSTGEPTTFIHDAASVRRMNAVMHVARQALGWRPGHADDLRVGRPARHRPGPHRLSTPAARPHQPAVAAARGRRLRADRGDRAPRPRAAPREPAAAPPSTASARCSITSRAWCRSAAGGSRPASSASRGTAARCCTTSR